MKKIYGKIFMRLIIWRWCLAYAIFPKQKWGSCANRHYRIFNTINYEMTLTLRDKQKPDGYEAAEFIVLMDQFLGRKCTQEEWGIINNMKGRK